MRLSQKWCPPELVEGQLLVINISSSSPQEPLGQYDKQIDLLNGLFSAIYFLN